jgi:hypothetical protein
MELNLNNAEELIFHDREVQKLLPEFQYLFNQWKFAFTNPGFRSMRKKSVMDLLDKLTDEHVEILENHLQSEIAVKKIDYHIIKNCEFGLDEAQSEIKGMEGFPYFSISRDKDHVYLSFWR